MRTLRQGAGMRVEDLASATGLASRTITRLEAGKEPSVSTLRRIAGAFGVSVADLLGGPTA